MTPLANWLFGAMVTLAPPDRMAALPQYAGYEESVVDMRSRYVAIAIDIDSVVTTEPPLPGYTRRGTAALLLGISWMESGWAPDADRGPCVGKRCDGGRAATIFQIQAPAEERARLFSDREYAVRRALALARRSMLACGGLEAYCAGSCTSLIGRAQARKRELAGRKILGLLP